MICFSKWDAARIHPRTIEFPVIANQRDALNKFESTLKEDNYEKRKGFFKNLKNMFK